MTKQRTSASRKADRPRRVSPATVPSEAVPALEADGAPIAISVESAPPAAPAPTLALGSSCVLADVAALRLACIAALDSKDPPSIDGSHVERVDAAGIQVLVGFTIDCMERSINFSWAGRSPHLAHAIRLLGVDALLESPGAATPMGGLA